MTVDLLLVLLRDLAALQSSAWPPCRGPVIGPALYLDRADTQALIAELTRIKEELATTRAFHVTGASGHPDADGPSGTGSEAIRADDPWVLDEIRRGVGRA